ncbi:MAG: amino acid ABC transporter permease [Pseudomonadota bacterium]
MDTAAFVRTEMVDPKEAPSSAVGPMKWLRDNLFSSPVNAILTLVSIFIAYYALSGLIPWIFLGVWNASSLDECREIFAARYGDGVEYACWAVIADRWDQVIFGFYSADQYWRPILGWILIGVAAVPVLVPNAPRWLFYVTVATLFIYPFLIWGGTIWPYVMAALGFVVGYVAYRVLDRVSTGSAFSTVIAVTGSVLAAAIWWIVLSGPIASTLAEALPIGIEAFKSRDLAGFALAITIGVVAIVASLPLAIALALGRQSDMFIVNKLSTGFIEMIRGVPLITLIFVAVVLLNYFLPSGTDVDPILAIMILVTLFTAAYIAEVIRAGLAAVPKGQYEAADSLGLNYGMAQRLIVLPQALKIAIPGIVSNFISVFKDTVLVSIVFPNDPLGIADTIRADSNWNGIVWELYGFIAFVFFVFCFAMSRYSMYLERRLQTGHK